MSFRAAAVLLVLVAVLLAPLAAALPGALAASPSGAPTTPAASPPTASTTPSASPVRSGTAPDATGTGPHAALEAKTLATLRAAGIPQKDEYLPNYNGGGVVHGNVVSPITLQAPSSMGIGDFGVRNTSGTPSPYVLHSSSWEGTVTFNSGDFFYIDNDGPDTFGVQLNTVLANTTVEGNSSGAFWIQDVMFYTPSNDSLEFLDNIWNLSNPSTVEPASTFHSGNGTDVDSTYYYAPGPYFTVGFPFTVHLYTNSSLTNTSTNTYSTVRFGYDLVSGTGAQIGHGIFDTVEFNSAVTRGSPIPLPRFEVNGGHLTPTNFLLYDSELMIGGPGGGSTTQIYAINGSMQLRYLDPSTSVWTLDPTAWTTGTDTGESSEGIAEYYTTAGTMELRGGPSIVEPMWNATPGGNAGEYSIRGTIAPDNSFVFVSNGTRFWAPNAQWAPVLPGGMYDFALPPGDYDLNVLLSDYDNESFGFVGAAGHTSWQNITLYRDPTTGVYTPLFAWNNAELANISSAGVGSASDPYILDNNQYSDLPYLFGEANDFLFLVFPAVLISETTAYFEILNPPSFSTAFTPGLAAALERAGLPDSDQLQIELYYTVHGTIWGGQDIGGFQDASTFAFPLFDPVGEVVLWGATDTLIGDNTFQDQGLGLVLMQGSSNTVWGNRFLNGLLYGKVTWAAQYGVGEFESGDLLYDNSFDTTVTAYSPSANLYDGNAQTNLDAWNLTSAEPSVSVSVVNGFNLTGSIVGAPTVCGNWWSTYLPKDRIPYSQTYDGTDYVISPSIATGGDYCPTGPAGTVTFPITFSETGDTSSSWSVTFVNVTKSAGPGISIGFSLPNGTWQYAVGAVAGLYASPPSGSVPVAGAGRTVPITFSGSSGPRTPEYYLVTISETGLAVGTAWTVDVGASVYSGSGSVLAFTAVNGTLDYTVPPVLDYSFVSAASGSVTVAGAAAAATIGFSPNPGWLNGTVTPSSAGVWVDGAAVVPSGGLFSLEESPGVYALEVAATGYVSYFNNVSVTIAHGTTLSVHLSSTAPSNSSGTGSGTSTSSGSSSGLSATDFDVIVLGLVLVAAAILVAALLLRPRPESPAPSAAPDAGYPPADANYSYPPPAYESGEASGENMYSNEPSGQLHPWEENPPPPQ
jgi:thermopsin